MRLTLLTFLLINLKTLTFAQSDPLFLLPFYFEDAVGNTDTLWLGGDPEGSYSEIQPQFGEVLLTAPFDSVFEVRAVHADDAEWKTSKIIVEDSDGGPFEPFLGTRTRIMIHAKYPPVRISWDSDYLNPQDIYDFNKVLYPNQMPDLLQYWWEAEYIYCMIGTDHFIEDFDYDYSSVSNFLFHDFEVEGQGMKSLPGLYFSGFYSLPHCQTTLDVNDFFTDESINIYPNPSKGEVFLESADGIKAVNIYATSGALVYASDMDVLSMAALDLSAFIQPGLYFVEIMSKNGIVSRRVLMMEQ